MVAQIGFDQAENGPSKVQMNDVLRLERDYLGHRSAFLELFGDFRGKIAALRMLRARKFRL